MAGYRIVHKIEDKKWRRRMAHVDAAASDLTPAMKDAGQYMVRKVDDRFRSEQGPDGVPWKPLKAVTLAKKKGSKILTEAGNRGGLRGSIVAAAGRNFTAHGTNKIYGAIHQLGGEAGRKSARVEIPARPYLGFNSENLDHIGDLILDHINPD